MEEKKIRTTYEETEVKFHLSSRCKKSLRKSKHAADAGIPAVKKALKINPAYGQVIAGRDALRKMRFRVPSLNVGKSGGYRLIYRKVEAEETIFIIFLEVYFKGDREDLSDSEYDKLVEEASELINSLLDLSWED